MLPFKGESVEENAVSQHRYDLDWLRVLAVFLLVPFHTALIALLSLAIVLTFYEYGIRRVNAVRVLFGLRPLPTHPIAQPVHIS